MRSRIWLGLVVCGLALLQGVALAGPMYTGMKVYIGQKNWEKAAMRGPQAIAEDPENSDVYNKFGIALAELDSLEHAGEVFAKGLQLAEAQKEDEIAKDIKQNRQHYYAAHANSGYQILSDATNLLDSLGTKADDKNPAVKAVKKQAMDGFNRAVGEYKKALALKPDDEKTWAQLGVAYSNLERDEDAMAAYQQALKINGDYKTARDNIRSSKIRAAERAKFNKDWAKATVIYTELVDAGDTTSLLDLGDVSFTRAKEAAPADTATRLGNMRKAAGYFGRYADMHPEDTTATFNYFVALQNARDTTASVTIAKKILGRDPYRKDYHQNLLAALVNGHNQGAKIAEQWSMQALDPAKGKLLPAAPKVPAATEAGKLLARLGQPTRVYSFTESGGACSVWFYAKTGETYAFVGEKVVGKSGWTPQ